MHQNNKDHISQDCGYAFYRRGKLNDHMKNHAHLKIIDNECQLCIYLAPTIGELRRQKSVHWLKQRLNCTESSHTFSTKYTPEQHMKKAKLDNPSKEDKGAG